MSIKPLIIVLFCLLTAPAADAEIVRYYDEEGTLIVTDDPFGTKKRQRQHYHRKQGGISSPALHYRDDVAYEFYEVSGNNVYEAIAETEKVGPFDYRKGRHFAGQTRWNYGLSYNLDFSYHSDGQSISASVQIRNIVFKSDITVTLPMLSGAARFEPHEFSIWEGFVKHLSEHEHDHVRIIQETRFRQEVISGIAGIIEMTLPQYPDEDAEASVRNAVEARIGEAAHEGMRKIKQKNEEYDRLTEHGQKHGLRDEFFRRLGI